jgi:hypothetical protein
MVRVRWFFTTDSAGEPFDLPAPNSVVDGAVRASRFWMAPTPLCGKMAVARLPGALLIAVLLAITGSGSTRLR